MHRKTGKSAIVKGFSFFYFSLAVAHGSLVRTTLSNNEAQARLRKCADSPEHSLLAYTKYGCKFKTHTILDI